MKASNWKRMLSGLMAVLMVLSNMPVMAFASAGDGLCAHHESHVECGYQEAVEGSECTHVCDESCYQTVAACVHVHGDCGYSAAVAGIPCDHVHGDCGWAEAVPGVPCDHVHGDCGYVEAVAEIPCDHVCADGCAESCVHTCGDGTCAYCEGTPGSDCTHVCGDGTCAYCEGTPGSECGHVCGDGTCAYTEGAEEVPCGHACSEASGCVTTVLNCQHTHDETCGYAESMEAKPCDYVCKVCHVQGMIDALPGTVTMDNASDVESTLAEIDAFCTTLSDDELAQVDMTKFDAAAQALSGLAAAPAAEDDSCGAAMTWSFDADSGKLTISGEGYMYDYHEVAAPWAAVAGDVTSVVIEDGVSGIGNNAFQNFSKLTSVSFGQDVSWIGGAAFLNCTSLEEIALPDGLESVQGGMFHGCTNLKSVHLPDCAIDIGGNAFAECVSLTSITVPEDVERLGDYAFGNCTNLETIVLPEGLISISDAFAQCSSLTTINIPSTVREIGELAFWNCKSLEQITLPEGLTVLPNGIFNGCESLSSVNIPSTVTEIGGHVFLFCYQLKNVTIPEDVTTIGESAFNQMGIESIVIPNSVTSMGESQFFGCNNLTSVTIGSGLTEIPANAFTMCGQLTEITIPGNVKTIGPGAFADTGLTALTLEEGITTIDDDVFAGVPLTEVTIPASVTRLGGAAFADSGLEQIIFLGDAPEIAFDTFANVTAEVVIPENNDTWTEENMLAYGGTLTWPGAASAENACGDSMTWSYNEETTTLTISGSGYMYDYHEVTAPWASYADEITSVVIDNGVRGIGNAAFRGCTKLTDVSFGRDVSWIGDGAFDGCTALQSVTLPDGLQEIRSFMFAGCTGLKTVVLPENATSLGMGAFTRCSALTAVNIPAGITVLNGGTFDGCSSLESIDLPEGLTTIGEAAFANCTSLTDINIPSGVTEIGELTFWGCSSLTEIVLPEGLTKVPASIFNGCTNLSSVTIPSTVIEIGSHAFLFCNNLKSITLPAGVTTIGEAAFNQMGIESVVIPNSVTAIGESLFYGSDKLTSVTIGTGLKEIPANAFTGCTSLSTVNFSGSVSTIGAAAFADCTGLELVFLPYGLKTIESNAFAGCTGITDLVFGGSAPDAIAEDAFAGVTANASYLGTDDTWAIFPKENYGGTITWIADYPTSGQCGDGDVMWQYNAATKTLTLSGSGAVYDFITMDVPWDHYKQELTNIVIADTITAIGGNAFADCPAVTEVTIPASVTTIGQTAFANCSALTNIKFLGNMPAIDDTAFTGVTATVRYPFQNTTWNTANQYGGQLTYQMTIPLAIQGTSAWTDVLEGDTAYVAVYAMGQGLTYEWFYANAGSDTFIKTESFKDMEYSVAMTAARNGRRVYCVITDAEGNSITSDTFTLTMVTGTDSGECGEGVTWAFDASTATLTISGKGTMVDYTDDTQRPWHGYRNAIKHIQVDDGVTHIGSRAFNVFNYLVDISLPDSVTSMGIYALAHGGLKSFTVPAGLREIPGFLLEGCANITSLVIPDTVTAIGDGAFFSCNGLTEIRLSNSLTAIPDGMLYYCPNLKTLTIPAGVTSIGSRAISQCHDGIEYIVFTGSAPTIAADAFEYTRTTVRYPANDATWTDAVMQNYGGELNWEGMQQLKITAQPESVTVPEGTMAVTVVEVQGDGLTYQWYYKNAGAENFLKTTAFTGNYYQVEMTPGRSNRQVYCVITDQYGNSVTTDIATLRLGSACGETLTWSYDSITKVLNISGSGYMYDYHEVTAPWASYADEITAIVIDNGVRGIGNAAFRGCTKLTDVSFGRDVNWIGDGAFDGCTALQSVTLPDGLQEIRSFMFAGCTSLKTVILPENATSLGMGAFTRCSALTAVNIPAGITVLNGGTFDGCSSLESIDLPEGLTTIGEAAFANCAALTDISIPSGVTEIGELTFWGCSSLTEIVLPEGLTKVPAGIFNGCTNLSSVTIPSTVIEIGSHAFLFCNNLKSITLPAGVTTIGEAAFNQMGIESVVIPNSVTAMGESQFFGCQNLKSVTIGTGLTELTANAFTLCENLTEITVPANVKTIGAAVFADTGLEKIVFEGNAPAIAEDAFGGVTATAFYPNGNDTWKEEVLQNYGGNITWHETVPVIVWGTDPSPRAFALSGGTVRVYAYANGENLKFQWYRAEAGSDEFKPVSGATAPVYTEVMTAENDQVQVYCEVTNDFNGRDVSETVTLCLLAETASGQCGANAYWELDASTGKLTVTGIGAMYDYKNNVTDTPWAEYVYAVRSIEVKEGITHIGSRAFQLCAYATSVSLPGSLTSMGEYAFAGCESLTSFPIPAGLSVIPVGMLELCSGIRTLVIPDTVTEIQKNAFFVSGIRSITLPSGLTAIPEGMLYYCQDLTEITIPASVTSIGEGAMALCFNLKKIIFEGGAPSIVENAFQNVTATVSYPAEDTSWTDEVRQNYGGNLTWNGKYDLKIIRQPESVAAANGATAKVTFEAQGDGLTYTWYFKDTAHTKFYKTTSFTGPSYQIQMNSTRAGRQVYCVVTDKYGSSVTTDTVTLNMAAGVKIVQQPVSTEEEEGVNAIVTVRAEGDGLTYQWYFKDTTHTKFYLTTSFKGASYTVQMNESRNGRQVYCVITDQYGNTVTTDTVTLTMSVPKTELKITKQPVSVTVVSGATAKVTLTAQGDGLTYAWYFKNAGAKTFSLTTSFTGNSYSVKMDASRDGRQIYCIVTDQYGDSVQSNTVTLNMATALKITQQPKSVEGAEGEKVITSVRAQGDGLTYSWYYKDKGATKFTYTKSFKGASYSVEMNEARDGRQVYCIITDQYGNTVTTDIATLTMSAPKTELKITKQPVSVTAASGTTVKITLTAQGDGLTYKWYFKNAGAKNFSLTTSFTGNSYSVKMDASRDGRQVYCVVTDQYGDSVQSNTVTLTMAASLKITQQPKSVEAAAGVKAITTVKAEGDGLTYSWYFKDKGAADFSYTKSFRGASYSVEMNEARDGRQVYCVITDQYGNTVTTDIATLTMSTAGTELKITKQPVSVSVAEGVTAKVTFTAQGDGLTYKWYFKNANASTFSLTTTFTGNSYSAKMDASRDGRQVYCVVTDQYGNTVTTDTVTISMS